MPRKFHVKQGSLTDGDSLLLVNASNTNCNLGTGVSMAIRMACGSGYQDHIHNELQQRRNGPLEPGEVLITDAGAHAKAQFVAHVAVMDYRQGFSGQAAPDEARIETACAKLWQAVEELDYPGPISIAMVALGAGTGGLGVRKPTQLACATLKTHLNEMSDSKIGDVTFYGYLLPEFLVVAEVVSSFFAVEAEDLPPELNPTSVNK